MKDNKHTIISRLSEEIAKYVNLKVKNLDYDCSAMCIVTQIVGPETYKIRINDKEHTATSYFDFSVGSSAYAIAPQNNYGRLFLLPYHK